MINRSSIERLIVDSRLWNLLKLIGMTLLSTLLIFLSCVERGPIKVKCVDAAGEVFLCESVDGVMCQTYRYCNEQC